MKSQLSSRPIRERILLQHDYTCQACGAEANDVGGKAKMRVGFVPRNDSSLTLTDVELKTLCPDCDDGFATATLFPRMNAKDLMQEIDRAPVSDQLAVLDWTLKRYPHQESK